jgi:hypothetical protein
LKRQRPIASSPQKGLAQEGPIPWHPRWAVSKTGFDLQDIEGRPAEHPGFRLHVGNLTDELSVLTYLQGVQQSALQNEW